MSRRLADLLQLSPHPEGGAYREFWRSPATIAHPGNGAPRSASTGIYFLLREGEFSALHEVRSDEFWILLDGGPLELHCIAPDGAHSARILHRGEAGKAPDPIHVVPAGHLQAARPCHGVEYSLCCCIVAPGFDFADFRMPPAEELIARFPDLEDFIASLTRQRAIAWQ
ncbi:cupin domain-containing protein [bacterium]|nr:cupin domain-containing protein [bacterium]